MPTPRLSVVVPFFDVEDYVVPCLESLRRQTLADLEVVLVDDGSRDGTRAHVEKFVAADDRFRLVTQDNQGLGPARNTGVRHAQGEYLAFIDSDDIVPRRAFARMVESLEATGSDFAAGNARRFNTLGVRQSFAHRIAFQDDRLATTIREMPELGLDRMAWNKVYRRSFWDAADLAFPAMLYEDYPVSMAAHLRARSVDVISDAVCYWRERDGGEPSITQRTWHLGNLQDRVDSALTVLALVEEAGLEEVRTLVARHLLHIDVSAVIGAVHQNDPVEHPSILAMAQRLLAQIPPDVRTMVGRFDALQAALIERGLLRELEQLEAYRAAHGMDARIVTRGRWRKRRFMELPFFDAGVVPLETFELPDSTWRLRPALSDGHWQDGALHLDIDLGLAPMPVDPRSTVQVWAETKDGRRLDLPVERYEKAALLVGRDLSGVRTRVDPTLFPEWDRPGFWALHVGLRSRDFTGSVALRHVAHNRGRYLPSHWLDDEVRAQPCRRHGGLGVWVGRPKVVVEHATALHDELELRGWLRVHDDEDDVPVVLTVEAVDGTTTTWPVAVELEAPEGWERQLRRWSARVPVEPLITHGPDFDPIEERERFALAMQVGGSSRPLAVGPRFGGAAVCRAWRSILATRSPIGQLVLLEAHVSPRLVEIDWAGKGRLRVRGVWEGPGAMAEEVYLRSYPRPLLALEHTLPVHVEDGVFTVDIDWSVLAAQVEGIEGLRDQRFHAHPWSLLFPFGSALVNPVLSRDLPSAMPGPQIVGQHKASVFVDRGDVARLLVRRL